MQIAMVIDLQKCVGCGACAIACKTENNTQTRARGQSFNWADFIYKTEGAFPEVKYAAIPVRCNHCSEPECMKQCPKPKALYKTEEGITMFNYKYCIQCKKCQDDCPYSARDVDKAKVAYSVISYNEIDVKTHDFYKDKTALITGCTSSPAEVAGKDGAPPYRHAYTFRDDKKPLNPKESQGRGELKDVRTDGWVEKCDFCIHRLRKSEKPYCVESCPANARIVGNIEDPGSEVSQLIKKHKPTRLKNNKGEWLKDGEKGTKPNVYYIKSFKAESQKA
ncbi:MAG: 4Fe-4S dicluster domain-containing protein [Deltaproteobacteria bacterium]|nr:4Fe-4S dicluster domain-containing protein [Deltaproteobacteria bacterium]